MLFSHCHQCGQAYGTDAKTFPKTCASCAHTHYKNPIPVAVCMVPCEDGLLGVVRANEPKVGMLALPGGFVDMETAEQACSRELFEETGVELDSSVWRYASSFLTPNGNLLMFFEARVEPIAMPRFPYALPPGAVHEVDGFDIIHPHTTLAFPSHEDAARALLGRMGLELAKPSPSLTPRRGA